MGKNIIVYDIETKHAFDEVGGRSFAERLGISVLGYYDYEDEKYRVLEEKELNQFEERLSRSPLLVGFNSKKFDTPILQTYIRFSLKKLSQLDILEEITKVLGHRLSLNSVARGTLKTEKSGDGLDAIRLYKNGEMEKLKKYCLDDVRITKDIYEYVAANKELLFISKFNNVLAKCPLNWEIRHPDEADRLELQQSLF